MERKDIGKDIPDTPGVYLFKKGRTIQYIGKATSLRDRVRSYFSGDLVESRGQLVAKMIEEATSVDWQETDSVLEALLLEAHLIKKHDPPANSMGKDNKSYAYVILTKEDFPKLLLARERELQTVWDPEEIKYSFGPFIQGGQLREALKIIRKIFPYRDDKCKIGGEKPCFNRQIGLCPGTCTGEITKTEYSRVVRNLKYFFEGQKGKLLKQLEKDMKTAAKEQKFEKAERIKRQVFALEHINDIALIKHSEHVGIQKGRGMRIEAYDVAHISGTDTVGVMVVVEEGMPKKSDYRKFKVRGDKGKGDTHSLQEVLERRLGHDEWPLPRMIVVDGAKAQINAAKKVLDDFGYEIPIIGVVKNERHQPKRVIGTRDLVSEHEGAILLANSEAHRFAIAFHRERRSIKRKA